MEEGLNLNNIMSEEEISGLFGDSLDVSEQETDGGGETPTDENKKATEEEVDAENLFNENPKSVGGEEGQEETPSKTGASASSKSNFYASTIGALVGDGVFTGLTDEDIAEVKDPESFANAIEKEINAKLDARQRRVQEALDYGVGVDEIRRNEAINAYLSKISEGDIDSDTDEAVQLRRNLISQDLMNRGYTEAQIIKKVNDIFEAGNDIDEARDALKSNRAYFANAYKNMVDEKRREKEAADAKTLEETRAMEESILKDKDLLGGLTIDDTTRKKIVENTMSPIFKDESTNTYYTAIQKYQREHPLDFVKNLGILYTLTNGFTNVDGLIKGRVKKEVKSHLKELEHAINSTTRNSDGSFSFASGVSDDESVMHAGWKIDI